MMLSEQAAIGSILIDCRALPALRAECAASDFSDDTLRAIFTAACELADAGAALDPVTIIERAGAREELAAQLMATTPTAANVSEYGRLVHREAMARVLSLLGASLLSVDASEIGAAIASATRELGEIAAGLRTGLKDSGELCAGFFKDVEQLCKGEKLAGTATGFRSLDSLLGGSLVRGGLYILAARPGIGKTTFALNIAAQCHSVLFVSLEMSGFQIMSRRTAMRSGVPIVKIVNGKTSADDMAKIAAALSELSKKSFALSDSPRLSVDDVAALARGVAGLQLVIVDYLGLIKSKDGKSLYEKVTFTSGELKRLARAIDCPVLCLAQLNRASEARQDKVPLLSDLRDSGAIEQDADGVLLLSDGDGDDRRSTLNLELAKNRHGRTGRLEFDFYRLTGRVVER